MGSSSIDFGSELLSHNSKPEQKDPVRAQGDHRRNQSMLISPQKPQLGERLKASKSYQNASQQVQSQDEPEESKELIRDINIEQHVQNEQIAR